VYSRYGIGVTVVGTDRDQFLGKKKPVLLQSFSFRGLASF